MSSDVSPPSYTESQREPAANAGNLLEIHHGLQCDGCLQNPIVGSTYRCKECPDFKICSNCCDNPPPTFQHPRNHPILLVRFIGPDLIRDTDIIHLQITCDSCQQRPLRGMRFHCKTCPDYDLCQSCAARPPTDHPSTHRYICLSTPTMWTYHFGQSCDGCGLYPIVGPRYHCVNNTCVDQYDLCSDCMNLGIFHPASHPMIRVLGQPPPGGSILT